MNSSRRFDFSAAAGVVLLSLQAISCGGQQGETPSSAQTPAAAPAQRSTPRSDSPAAMVPGHAPTPMAGGTIAHAARTPEWEMPEGWRSETPSSRMRKAQYRIPASPGDAEDGECAVFYFGPGQGGDLPSNIARWAGQFSSPSGEPARAEVTEVKAGGFDVTRVEVGGNYRGSPMSMAGGSSSPEREGFLLLGAIIPGGDANWFVKCTGPQRTMEENREAFDAMIASVR